MASNYADIYDNLRFDPNSSVTVFPPYDGTDENKTYFKQAFCRLATVDQQVNDVWKILHSESLELRDYILDCILEANCFVRPYVELAIKQLKVVNQLMIQSQIIPNITVDFILRVIELQNEIDDEYLRQFMDPKMDLKIKNIFDTLFEALFAMISSKFNVDQYVLATNVKNVLRMWIYRKGGPFHEYELNIQPNAATYYNVIKQFAPDVKFDPEVAPIVIRAYKHYDVDIAEQVEETEEMKKKPIPYGIIEDLEVHNLKGGNPEFVVFDHNMKFSTWSCKKKFEDMLKMLHRGTLTKEKFIHYLENMEQKCPKESENMYGNMLIILSHSNDLDQLIRDQHSLDDIHLYDGNFTYYYDLLFSWLYSQSNTTNEMKQYLIQSTEDRKLIWEYLRKFLTHVNNQTDNSFTKYDIPMIMQYINRSSNHEYFYKQFTDKLSSFPMFSKERWQWAKEFKNWYKPFIPHAESAQRAFGRRSRKSRKTLDQINARSLRRHYRRSSCKRNKSKRRSRRRSRK